MTSGQTSVAFRVMKISRVIHYDLELWGNAGSAFVKCRIYLRQQRQRTITSRELSSVKMKLERIEWSQTTGWMFTSSIAIKTVKITQCIFLSRCKSAEPMFSHSTHTLASFHLSLQNRISRHNRQRCNVIIFPTKLSPIIINAEPLGQVFKTTTLALIFGL